MRERSSAAGRVVRSIQATVVIVLDMRWRPGGGDFGFAIGSGSPYAQVVGPFGVVYGASTESAGSACESEARQTALATEAVLRRDWDEEDEAWGEL